MGGAELASHASLNKAVDRVLSGVLAGWGPVQGFCFEASNCGWNVDATHRVDVILDTRSSRIERISTNAPGWRTKAGIGSGSTVASLAQAYGHAIEAHTTCGLNGFGGDNVGWALRSRYDGEARFTFFEVASARRSVSRVWIGRGVTSMRSGC